MRLLNRLFGYRWSLYIVLDGDQLIYAMHENSVMRLVGYVMGCFANGGRPTERWSLHLNFNKKHQAFKLEPEHFTPDGTSVHPKLIQMIESIDPGWQVPGAKPVFVEVATKKQLKIGDELPGQGNVDLQAMLENIYEPKEINFFFVMDKVFGKS